jgi:hypothetical protein
MVPALELTEEEVLEPLKKVLKGMTIVPRTVPEYHVDQTPPSISCFVLREYFPPLFNYYEYFMSLFLLLTLLFFGCL